MKVERDELVEEVIRYFIEGKVIITHAYSWT